MFNIPKFYVAEPLIDKDQLESLRMDGRIKIDHYFALLDLCNSLTYPLTVDDIYTNFDYLDQRMWKARHDRMYRLQYLYREAMAQTYLSWSHDREPSRFTLSCNKLACLLLQYDL